MQRGSRRASGRDEAGLFSLRVVGLVGRAGAGKDTVSGIVERKYPSVRMGDVVIEETRRRGLSLTDANVGSVANELRRSEGMDAIAARCVGRIRSTGSQIVLVNGIRSAAEVRLLRKEFEEFVLVEVHASAEKRYERILARSREDDVEDFQQFLARDRREASWGLGEAIGMADHRISNEGSIEELETRTAEVMDLIEES